MKPLPLLSSGIQTLPHNAKVHYNYANFLKDSGRHQEAIHHYATALRWVLGVQTDPGLTPPPHPGSISS